MTEYPYHADIGQTDLMGAAYNGDAGEVTSILTMPCDVDAQDAHGVTALMYAAMEGHAEVVQCLIEQEADLELQSNQRFTALMYAVREDQIAVVRALLAAGADPDVHEDDDTFETPLSIAASKGLLACARALVGAGANVALRGGLWQLPPEAVARRAGHHDVSEFLLYHEKRPSA